MANRTAPHILNTAANLLGFCLIVITSLRVANKAETHMIDELTAVIALMLTFSCGFSFVAIRTSNEQREKRLENTADVLFMTSLAGILIIILLITFNILK